MNELIKITENNGKKAVSARELYSFLSIDDGSHFADWGKRNIEEMFFQYADFQILRYTSENGGRPGIDYALTIDCAKEVSMMSRCEKGKQARLYFIQMEKVALNATALPDFSNPVLAARAWADAMEQKQLSDNKVKELEPKAQYHDEVLTSKTAITTTVIAKELGMSAEALNKKLHALGIQFKVNGTWILYAKYQNMDYTKTKTATFEDSKGNQQSHIQTYWTEKGRNFIHSVVKGSYVYSHS